MAQQLARTLSPLLLTLLLFLAFVPARAAEAAGLGSYGDKSRHPAGVAFTAGVPQLLALDVRVTALSHFEFGAGYGAFPVNALANSIYQFQPTAVDLGTSDRYNLYPTGSYGLSGIFAFARFFPSSDGGFFVHLGIHSVNFSANINGSLKNETTGGVTNGALSGSIGINQPLVMVGPGWQFLIGKSEYQQSNYGSSYYVHASTWAVGANARLELTITERLYLSFSLGYLYAKFPNVSYSYAATMWESGAWGMANSYYRNDGLDVSSVRASLGIGFRWGLWD
jgi:hypothetical protein